MNTEERLKREKEFHNETFSTNSRKAASKYYKSAGSSLDFYKNTICNNIQGKKVLEYGCGPGSASFDLARLGAEVYAIDISDVAIEQTKAKALSEGLEIHCSVMDAENLSFEDATFDLICGRAILHHLDLERSYSELKRTLKPDGKAVFFEPLGHNPIINIYRYFTPKMRTVDEHPLLIEDIKLAEKYFAIVNSNHFNLIATASSFLPFLSRILNNVDKFLFKMLPFLKKYSWITVIEFSKPK
tara:strand:- start:58929 stop:59657 length:729 start_codon:yes stop_codon:yes gene_type:complete